MCCSRVSSLSSITPRSQTEEENVNWGTLAARVVESVLASCCLVSNHKLRFRGIEPQPVEWHPAHERLSSQPHNCINYIRHRAVQVVLGIISVLLAQYSMWWCDYVMMPRATSSEMFLIPSSRNDHVIFFKFSRKLQWKTVPHHQFIVTCWSVLIAYKNHYVQLASTGYITLHYMLSL